MNDKLFYCYEKLSESNNLNISEEEFVKAIELIEHFVSHYTLKVSNPYKDNNAYYLGLTDSDITNGYIVINPEYVGVEIISCFYPQLMGREYLYVYKNKFKGRYCNFVYNVSSAYISINDRELAIKGTLAKTDFDSDGCYLNGELIPYATEDNIEKLNTAYRANIECGRQLIEDFLTLDELNIASINFVDEGFESGNSKIF